MNKLWFSFLLVPLVYGCLAVKASKGLRGQLAVVTAGSPNRFTSAVERAGGPDAVRRGLTLDWIFIGLFAAVAIPLLRYANGYWALPLAAACLDAVEAVVLAPMLGVTPGRGRTRLLAVIAWCKMLAYISVIALVAARLAS